MVNISFQNQPQILNTIPDDAVYTCSQYVGIRCCSHSTSKILCMHKIFRRMPTNGQYAEGSFTERNPNGMFVLSTVTVRFLNDGIRPTKLLAHL